MEARSLLVCVHRREHVRKLLDIAHVNMCLTMMREETRGLVLRMQIETVKTDTFTMDYFKFGQGERTLVIIPGLSVQSVMISANAVASAYQPLTNDFTIYVFDRRKELPASYSVREMARDTAEAFRALDLRQAAVFGASQGGMIAMTMAIEHPDLVQELVLCSTAARMAEARHQAVDQWVKLAQDGDATGLYLAFGEAIFTQDMFEQLRELLVETAKSVTDEDLSRFIILAEGLKDFDVSSELEKITCPVFIVGSKDDQVLGADATDEIAEHLSDKPGFALHMYEGFGHAAYDTAPDFKERMLRFLVTAN